MGETGSCSDGRAMFSKSLIQFSVDGQSCVPSLLFDLRPNYGGGNENNGNLLQKIPYTQSCGRSPQTYTPTGDSWTLTDQCWSVLWGHCSFLLGPGVHKVLFVLSKSLLPQFCVSSGSSMVGLLATSSKARRNNTKKKKKKERKRIQAIIPDEHRCNNFQQCISKLNSTVP